MSEFTTNGTYNTEDDINVDSEFVDIYNNDEGYVVDVIFTNKIVEYEAKRIL